MSKTFELRVKVVEIGETEEIGNNGFKKREVIGMIEGEYPEHYKFEFVQSKVDLPDTLIPGTYVTMFFNIKGKKVEGDGKKKKDMYFATLSAWKVEGAEQ